MSEINFRPNDKIMSTSEIFKNLGIVIAAIGFFDFLFYMIYIEDGNIFPFIFCGCLLYTSPSPRDGLLSRMPSSA